MYRKYLDWMVAKGFVTVTPSEDGDRVAITPKGLETYHRLVVWIKETMGDEHL